MPCYVKQQSRQISMACGGLLQTGYTCAARSFGPQRHAAERLQEGCQISLTCCRGVTQGLLDLIGL